LLRSFILPLLIAAALLGGHLRADDLAQNQAALQAVSKALKALETTLAGQQQDVSSARQALQEVEREMADLQQKSLVLNQTVATQKAAIARLGEQKSELQAQLATQKDQISAVLRLAYKQNNQPLITQIVNNQNNFPLGRHKNGAARKQHRQH